MRTVSVIAAALLVCLLLATPMIARLRLRRARWVFALLTTLCLSTVAIVACVLAPGEKATSVDALIQRVDRLESRLEGASGPRARRP